MLDRDDDTRASVVEELSAQDRLDRARRQHMARHPDCRDPDHPGCSACLDDARLDNPPPRATPDEALRLAKALAGVSYEWGEVRGRVRIPAHHRDKEFQRHIDELTQKLEAEVSRLVEERNRLACLVAELEESSSYWSEYEVPLGIVGRIGEAMKMVRGEG